MKYDLVIRNGTVLDGTGSEAIEADVAISGDKIREVGQVTGSGLEEIDAKGMLVTPGFVDVHTHYDGQATWDNEFAPSSNHGVTTVVMGNCGVGFAPCRPEDRQSLLSLMEGVEDIPEIVMSEGVPWNWVSFPEYLEALSHRRGDVDFAALVPHGPVRLFVMGKRGAAREPATDEDIAKMAEVVRAALAAGGIGFSTTLTYAHRTSAGDYSPTYQVAVRELEAIARAVGTSDHGVFQLIRDFDKDPEQAVRDFGLIESVARICGRPTFFTLSERPTTPGIWRVILDQVERANASGAQIFPEVFARPPGQLLGLDLSAHPFSSCPSYEQIRNLPLDEKVRAMRDAGLRARLLSEEPVNAEYFRVSRLRLISDMYELGDPPNYEPAEDQRLDIRAKNLGMSPLELVYEVLLKDGGRNIIYRPMTNYENGNLDNALAMIVHPDTLVALGDGGAHYGSVCDASYSTYMLTYWTRDRARGGHLKLKDVVNGLTQRPALAFGLQDRGVLAVGAKADVNVIDYDHLRLGAPFPLYDLPAGGRRLHQKAEGYRATIVSGVVTRRDGSATRRYPGRLIRAAKPNPLRP